MNSVKTNMQENAKVDWMKLVNRHRKKQRGLPALSRLNTNAGNVEHNIEMFNMMQPDGSITVDSSNGNVSSNDGACCEAMSSDYRLDYVTLEYANIPVEHQIKLGNPMGYYDSYYGMWLPDDGESEELYIDWSYEVPKQEIIDYLAEKEETLEYLNVDEDIDSDRLNQLIDAHFDELFVALEDDIYKHFYDRAVANARENYVHDTENHEDPRDRQFDKLTLDDKFDMSMRSLL